MDIIEHLKEIPFEDVEDHSAEKVRFSSKMMPYVDNERSFLWFTRCKSNVLAEADKDDTMARAMCKRT